MIKDVKILSLKPHVDDRGYLIELLRASDKHFEQFGQIHIVGNFVRNTIRAWRKHRKMSKLFFISHGSAKFALVDDHSGSPTYEKINTFVIGKHNPALLLVPPDIYYGWMSLEDDTQLIAIASDVYNRDKPDEMRVPPDSFDYDWSIQFK